MLFVLRKFKGEIPTVGLHGTRLEYLKKQKPESKCERKSLKPSGTPRTLKKVLDFHGCEFGVGDVEVLLPAHQRQEGPI